MISMSAVGFLERDYSYELAPTEITHDAGWAPSPNTSLTVIHGAMGCGQNKKNLVSVAVPPAPVLVPRQRSLVPSVASITSVANDNVADNEMILGAVHRSPGICLTAEENPRKPQLGDHLMKGL